MKTKGEILKILQEMKPKLEAHYNVKTIGIFGSVVREEPRRQSDIDVLVEFYPPIGLFKFLELEELLSERLGGKVDLVSKKALKPEIGRAILAEVVACMKRTYYDYVADILTCFQETQEFTEGMDFDAFATDRKTVNAVVRSLEVMGEAAKRIPPQVREKYPKVPWKWMTGMRDKLIHEYSGVDLEIVWGVIKMELPPLKALWEQMLRDLKKQE